MLQWKKEKHKNKREGSKIQMNSQKINKIRKEKGITLIALVITTIFSYDEKLKCSNYNGFLLETI